MNLRSITTRLLRAARLALPALLCSACGSLAPIDHTSERSPPPASTALWSAMDGARRTDWYALLNDGPTALDWRLRAIDSASESIELQTFLWSFDTVGSLVLDHLVAAAERGVVVKLLVDDTFLAGEDPVLLELQQHPNIRYRVYNPYRRRAGGMLAREVLNLGEFRRLDHRMHNKVMIVDGRVAIIGGRNLADEYFGLHATANFRDMELITGGPGVQTMGEHFDAYWNDRWSIPVERLSHVRHAPADLEAARRVKQASGHLHREETPEVLRARWSALLGAAHHGESRLLVDRPPQGNPGARAEAPLQVANALIDVLAAAQSEILIVSAYLIPTPQLQGAIADAVARGVRVRLLTNSIRSNNHLAAHSAYRNHIDALLASGAELHEVRADATSRDIYMLAPVARKTLALHAKTLVIDRDQVFVGSANLDPRSLRINTEMGLLVSSGPLNADVRRAVAPDFARANAWELVRDGSGAVTWVSDTREQRTQPAASFMQNLEDWFLAHLPIEEEL
jgi:putative cardiolipin synthase